MVQHITLSSSSSSNSNKMSYSFFFSQREYRVLANKIPIQFKVNHINFQLLKKKGGGGGGGGREERGELFMTLFFGILRHSPSE